MKLDALSLNMLHHFFLFVAFVYWSKTMDVWNAFGIMGLSVFIGYFVND
jgi:hypothetical protein